MIKLYSLLLIMALGALLILAAPYRKNIFSKYFLLLSLFVIGFSFSFYYFSANITALNAWLTSGKQHYQLLETIKDLGGIDVIIASVKKKLAANPQDAQGWFILGKLYFAMHDYENATTALQRAYELQPQNVQIRKYRELLKEN